MNDWYDLTKVAFSIEPLFDGDVDIYTLVRNNTIYPLFELFNCDISENSILIQWDGMVS